ncbi:MAG: class II glutamine amidotransferase [Alcanivoracaceae bacterium]|nr:class II glutamine amidotransferase [Alcanivoracaceae bacterium]
MCELFALSSSSATEISFSLDEFSKHGGLSNHHRHGWGIAYYQQNNDNALITLPDLHVLLRSCNIDLFATDIKGLEIKKQQAQNVVLISSVPLNDENWVALDVAESMVLKMV